VNKITLEISQDDQGQRLDTFIAENIEELSRSYVQKLIAEGAITVNEKTVKANYKLKENDLVIAKIPDPQPIKIEPENIIVIGGPAPGVAPILEKKFNLPYQIPKNFEIANAVGAALTRRTFEITLLADTEQGTLAVPEMGIYRKIAKTYDLSTAKEDALNLLKKQLSDLNATSYLDKAEIIEASSFNMIRGFFTSGKNIRVRAQIKPGLISRIGGIF